MHATSWTAHSVKGKNMFFKNLIILFILIASFTAHAESNDKDLKLSFGNIENLKCCTLFKKGEKATYDGFLLKPYQLVYLKDTIDTWQEELTLQLQHNSKICDEKISLCQENRELLISQLKEETLFYSNMSEELNEKVIKLKSEYKLFKIITYITIPVVISLGAYVTYKF